MKYLIDFKNTATTEEIQSYLSVNNCTILKEWDNLDKIFLVEVSNELSKTEFIEHIILDEGVKITPHYDLNNYWGSHDDPTVDSITVSTEDEKDWWKNYSYEQPVFDEPSFTLARFGEHISVYVMDSGFTDNSPDEFAGVNIVNLYSILGTDFTDCNGHGTVMSSLISGRTCGITNATIKVVKIFDDNVPTLQSQFLDALDAIIADHNPAKFGVVNCSWTIPKNTFIEAKLRILNDNGVYIIAAAGNNGSEIEDVTPASMPEALTVGAYNKDLQPCTFSNYSDLLSTSDQIGTTNHGELDGWAPGEKIWAYGIRYGWCNGTSPAAAITSAVVVNNLHRYCGDDGSRLPFTNSWNLNTLNPTTSAILAFSRPDLLELNDPKYTNSVNKIATIKDFRNFSNAPVTDEFNFSVRVDASGEQGLLGQVAVPATTKSVIDITPMPSFCQLMPNGMLYAAPTAADGPLPNDLYKQYVWQFVKTNTQEISETVTVSIYVLQKNYQPTDLPEDHIINITLAQNCATAPFEFFCPITSPPPSCNNNCPGTPCCWYVFGKGESDCVCLA
jgi:hypothetical protein